MGTKEGERQSLTPSERRQREQRRKRMQQKRRRKKAIRMAILIAIVVLAIAIIGGIVYAVIKLTGTSGSKEARISAAGNTFTIMLDAGHGGADTGLTNESLEEKEVTMAIVSKLEIMFENYGYDVVLTRKEDERLSKEDRAEAVNKSGADLCVSVHLNYSEDVSRNGIEVYYKEDSDEGAFLAEKIAESAAAESGAAKGGTAEGKFVILTDTEIPTVLVEVGYASNTAEAENLADDSYRNLMAKGIAKGVIRSLDTQE